MSLIAILEGSAYGAGLAMGAASLLSIGPNNITLMREGLTGGRVALAAATVWSSKLVLLVAALALTDTIATRGLAIRPLLSWLGLLALCWFALSSLRAYLRAARTLQFHERGRETGWGCVRRILSIIWLNPLTYLETLFVPAALGASFMMPICRVLFISGLLTMATASCYGYAFGGRVCAPLFKRKGMVRAFDLASCVLLSTLAALMAGGLMLRRG